VNWSPHSEIIAVRTRVEDIHKAGDKWRCRWFQVIGQVIGQVESEAADE